MNLARIVSIAAVGIFACMGAQAAPASGDLYGTDFEADFHSTRSRAEVSAEAVAAVSNFKDYYVAPAEQPTAVTRAEVRSQAVMAVLANKIARGNFS